MKLMAGAAKKPMCKKCGEKRTSKMHKSKKYKSGYANLCTVCERRRRIELKALAYGDDLDETYVYCRNGCGNARLTKHEKGTAPPTNVMCSKCRGRDVGTVSRGAALPDHGRNSSEFDYAKTGS